MTGAETVDIVYYHSTHFNHMEYSQPHYFFISLGEDLYGIFKSIEIPRERMIIVNCITGKIISPTIK